MKRWWWMLPIVVIAAGITFGLVRAGRRGLAVGMATVTRGDFIREVSGTGSVEARVYTLGFARSGRVLRVTAREGDHVTAGAELAALDTTRDEEQLAAVRTDHAAKISALHAQEAQSLATLAKLQGELRDANRQLALMRTLVRLGAEANEQLRTRQRQATDLANDVASAAAEADSARNGLRAQLATLAAQIRGLEQTLRESRIVAPVAGIVSDVGFRPGESPTDGVIRLVEDGSLRVRAQISEAEAAELRPGLPARIELDSAPEQPLAATVDKIGAMGKIKGEGGSATLPVLLRFRDAVAATVAKANFTVTARITSLRRDSVLKIPLDALVEEEDAGVTRRYLWTVDPARSTVSRQPVTVKMRNLTEAAIDGIPEGTQVVTLPPETLTAGMRVRKQPPSPQKTDEK